MALDLFDCIFVDIGPAPSVGIHFPWHHVVTDLSTPLFDSSFNDNDNDDNDSSYEELVNLSAEFCEEIKTDAAVAEANAGAAAPRNASLSASCVTQPGWSVALGVTSGWRVILGLGFVWWPRPQP